MTEKEELEFQKIMKKMRERGIVPRIRYDLMVLRALKVVAVMVIGAGVVWVMMR